MRLIGLAVVLACSLILAPLAAEGQQPLKIPRIGLFPATQRLTADIERVAPQLKVRLLERHATTEADVTKIFASLKKGAVDGMVVISPS
jgi:hypothetical protein